MTPEYSPVGLPLTITPPEPQYEPRVPGIFTSMAEPMPVMGAAQFVASIHVRPVQCPKLPSHTPPCPSGTTSLPAFQNEGVVVQRWPFQCIAKCTTNS